MGKRACLIIFCLSAFSAAAALFLPRGLSWLGLLALAGAVAAFARLFALLNEEGAQGASVEAGEAPPRLGFEEAQAPVATAEPEDLALPDLDGADSLDRTESLRAAEEALILLPFLSRIIDAVPRKTEEAAFTLIEKFQRVRSLAEVASGSARKIEAGDGQGLDKKVALMSERSRESMASERAAVNQIVQLSRQNSKNLRDMSGEISSGIRLLASIEEIAQKSHLIALNLSIEAAHIGKQGVGFKVIASELRGLNDKTAEFSKQVTELLTDLRERSAAVFTEMAEKTDLVVKEVERGLDLSSEAVESLIDASTASHRLSRDIVDTVERIHAEMDGVLESLQFQDITRQMLEGAGFIAGQLIPIIDGVRSAVAPGQSMAPAERARLFESLRSKLIFRAKTKGEKEAIMEVRP